MGSILYLSVTVPSKMCKYHSSHIYRQLVISMLLSIAEVTLDDQNLPLLQANCCSTSFYNPSSILDHLPEQ